MHRRVTSVSPHAGLAAAVPSIDMGEPSASGYRMFEKSERKHEDDSPLHRVRKSFRSNNVPPPPIRRRASTQVRLHSRNRDSYLDQRALLSETTSTAGTAKNQEDLS